MMKKSPLIILLFSIVSGFSYSQVPDNDNFVVTHGPWLQNPGKNGMTVIWTTNKPAIPGVTITDPDGKKWFVRNSTDGIVDGGGTVHKVRIEGLEAGKEYKYSISSVQVLKYQAYKVYYGDTLNGKAHSFFTTPASKNEVTFVVINDVHENSGKLASYLKNADISGKDFFIFNGDMVDYLQTHEQLYPGFIDTAAFYFASRKPFLYVRGNHETRGYMARELKDHFDFPQGRFYYGFDYGPVHFTVLDCGEDKPDNNRYYYGLADYDAYRQKQLEWLKSETASESFRKAKYRIVIIHMPVIREEKQGYGMKYLADNFGPVLGNAGVNLVISAHTHRNAFIEKGKSGFSYPVIVNSNNTFLELFAGEDDIMIAVKDASGKQLSEYIVK